jgi:hypothetical protein
MIRTSTGIGKETTRRQERRRRGVSLPVKNRRADIAPLAIDGDDPTA